MGKSLNGKELGKGITQRRDGRYQARFINRFGKRQTLYAFSVTEISKKLREEQVKDGNFVNLIDKKMTLDEWYERWITTCKKHCRDTTKHTYAIQYNRIRESLGWRKLTGLNLIVLQDAFNSLATDKMRADCKALLVDILNRAVEAELLVKNNALGINPYIENEPKEEKRILSDEEVKILLRTAKRSTLYPIFAVALGTGMRIGEILGLTFDCVDFENGYISVEKTLCYLPNGGEAIYEFHPPKTRAGRRQIPMTEEVRDALLEQKARKDRIASHHNPRTGMENLVFCSKTNKPIHEANVRACIRWMIKLINEENPDLDFKPFTPHGLRHTFAT